jgi:hypothetical protein
MAISVRQCTVLALGIVSFIVAFNIFYNSYHYSTTTSITATPTSLEALDECTQESHRYKEADNQRIQTINSLTNKLQLLERELEAKKFELLKQQQQQLSPPPTPPPTTPPPPPPPSNEKNKNPFVFEIKVLTYNRINSLDRCLKSLAAADYDGDNVDITLYIDHFQQPPNTSVNEQLFQLSQRVLELVHNFQWNHGRKFIHYRQANAHLQFQWLESFYPLDDHTYAFIVEDDLGLSPYYYLYIKKLIYKYRYTEPIDKHIYGISMQKQRLVPGHNSGVKVANVFNGNQPYLYRLVGTWGQIVFPEHWREFRRYFDQKRFSNDTASLPFLGNMITDGWYKISRERLWTPWIIRWALARDYYNLYANFGFRALSVSYREGGVNFAKYQGPDTPLITRQIEPQFEAKYLKPNLIDSNRLVRYDYCFKPVPRGTTVNGPVLPDTARIVFIHDASSNNERYLYNQLCVIEHNTTKVMEYELRSNVYFFTEDQKLSSNLNYRGFNTIVPTEGVTLSKIITSVNRNTLFVYLKEQVLLLNPTSELANSESTIAENLKWLYITPRDRIQLSQSISSETNDYMKIANLLSSGIPKSSKQLSSIIESRNRYIVRDDDLGCLYIQCKK